MNPLGYRFAACSGRWRSDPVRPKTVNRVRAGRQQLSADPSERRRSSGRHLRGQAALVFGPGFRPDAGTADQTTASPGVGRIGTVAYQSLYRRYRSQTFAEIKGQPHVTQALQAAVAEGRHGHAYLFSGPRGTGKTSTARVLAKALNCENLSDGEPCGTCKSCVDIEHGRSFDLHELDAASNNKVDDIRDLIAKVSLGSPGRTKVYILDEVHMLTPGAENALLKTLEEPPPHVVFVSGHHRTPQGGPHHSEPHTALRVPPAAG